MAHESGRLPRFVRLPRYDHPGSVQVFPAPSQSAWLDMKVMVELTVYGHGSSDGEHPLTPDNVRDVSSVYVASSGGIGEFSKSHTPATVFCGVGSTHVPPPVLHSVLGKNIANYIN